MAVYEKNKVFLGGTDNGSTWREELIPHLQLNHFDPVVDDWEPKDIEIENNEKENECNVHLYVITSEMTGVYSIAEAVHSAHNSNKFTVFCVIDDKFDSGQLKSLGAVSDLIESMGGLVLSSAHFDGEVLNREIMKCISYNLKEIKNV